MVDKGKILKDFSLMERAHWELHLKAAQRDWPDNNEVVSFLDSKTPLPALKHPSYIHDWLEKPELRAEIEAYNG